ncbi:MAG: hypothetical protein ACYSXF_01285 [Planctomycetota bacterium]|jgi:hypothetical protein
MNARRNLVRVTAISLTGFVGGFTCGYSESWFVVMPGMAVFAVIALFLIIPRSAPWTWIGLMMLTIPSVLVGGLFVAERRRKRLTCPACKFSLVGLKEHRCPECGRPFTLEELHASAADLEPPHRSS